MIRAVLIGFAHMHVNEIAQYISEQPDFALVGCADVPPDMPEQTQARYTRAWNLRHVTDTFHVTPYDDYQNMLDTVKPDIAFVLTENFRKPEVVEACAKRKINVSVEKPMAVSYREALRIRDAAKQYGIEVFVNWPTAWRPYIEQLKQAMDAQLVGPLLKMYYINGHTGPLGVGASHRGVDAQADEMTDEARASTWWYHEKTGGGAYLDIGCYGCMYSRLFQPEQAQSVYAYGANLHTPYCDTADNLAAIIHYPHRYSLIEGTWTTPSGVLPSGPILYCAEGVLFCTRNEEGAPTVKALDLHGKSVQIPEIAYPQSRKNIAWQLAEHFRTGAPVYEVLSLERNLEVMALLDTLIRSAKSGHEEAVPL